MLILLLLLLVSYNSVLCMERTSKKSYDELNLKFPLKIFQIVDAKVPVIVHMKLPQDVVDQEEKSFDFHTHFKKKSSIDSRHSPKITATKNKLILKSPKGYKSIKRITCSVDTTFQKISVKNSAVIINFGNQCFAQHNLIVKASHHSSIDLIVEKLSWLQLSSLAVQCHQSQVSICKGFAPFLYCISERNGIIRAPNFNSTYGTLLAHKNSKLFSGSSELPCIESSHNSYVKVRRVKKARYTCYGDSKIVFQQDSKNLAGYCDEKSTLDYNGSPETSMVRSPTPIHYVPKKSSCSKAKLSESL